MSDMKTRILKFHCEAKRRAWEQRKPNRRSSDMYQRQHRPGSQIFLRSFGARQRLRGMQGENQGSIKNGLCPHLKLQIRRIADGNLDLFNQVRYGPDILYRVRIEPATLNDLA